MRRSAVLGILAALVIVWLAAIVYLSLAGPSPASGQAAPVQAPPSQPGAGGLSAANRSEPDRFALETVNPLVPPYPPEAINGRAEKTIYTIVGKDVDAQGRAATWIYCVRYGSGASFLVFDENGWSTLSARDTFSGTKIETGSLVNVSSVFLGNPGLFAAPGITGRQVEISENTVRVTVRKGTVQATHIFNATTGVRIQDHEER